MAEENDDDDTFFDLPDLMLMDVCKSQIIMDDFSCAYTTTSPPPYSWPVISSSNEGDYQIEDVTNYAGLRLIDLDYCLPDYY